MSSQLQQALGESRPTLLLLYNPNKECCKDMPALAEQLHESLGEKANIIAIDGTTNPDLMHTYKVASYPCWILFKDGAVAWRDYGRKHFGELEHMVRDFI